MKKVTVIAFLMLALGLQSCAVRNVERNRPNVVVVKKAPRNHRVVIIKNKRYYSWGGNYYRRTRKGYVLVKV